ncbi:uncharacterized protein LOC143454145 [Clavelina lepadiformis]|uniref:uncharacterized protein LOC143454145 n=1 Tax=Clavelina lepadiformis TaxID=159417 RepID=UPI0040426F97
MRIGMIVTLRTETEEELQELIEQVKDVKEIATRVEHADVVATVRIFMKLFMKRKVAMTYSLTGLGHGRKKVKKSFVESKLYQLLLSIFQHTVHKHTGSASIARAVSQALAGSRDWEGGRNERRNKSSDSGESTEPVSSESSPEDTTRLDTA